MLNKGDLKIIGVVMCTAQDETLSQFLQGLSQSADDMGYRLMVFNSFMDFGFDDSSDHPMKSIFKIMNFDILDGIIMFTESLKSPDVISFVMANAKEKNIPVVSLITPVKGAYNICFDYKENFHAIISHVIEKHGCKRIYFVAGHENNSFSDERIQCFRDEMNKHGLEVDERGIGHGNFWAEPTYQLMDKWLADKTLEKPDAIICANDSMAIAVCIKLEENDYRVPDDIIVTGHDGIIAERYHTPRLTNAVTNTEEAAARAIHVIDDVLNGHSPKKNIVVKSKLVLSESCGCKKIHQKELNRKISTLYSETVQQTTVEDQLNTMAAELSRAPDFTAFRHILSRKIGICWCGKAWICMPESAYTPRHLTADELADESTVEQPETSFFEGSKLMNVFAWSFGDQNASCEIEFDRADILPNLIDKLRECGHIFFAPVCFRNVPQGYVAFCTNLGNPHMTFTSMFMSYLNMTFELVMQKSFNNAAVSQLKTMYVKDFMTALYNRRGFYTRIRPQLERCISLKQDLVVVSVDMDGLKKINDTYGHNEGDAAIKTLAMLLSQSVSEDAITARFGGDEFVIASVCNNGEAHAAEFADKLSRKMEAYNEISDKPYKISASVGFTVTKPESVDGIDRLIEIADDIMYRQKETHHRQTRGR